MKSVIRKLVGLGHRLVPGFIKRPLRGVYRKHVYDRLFPEAPTPGLSDPEVAFAAAPYLDPVGERGRPTIVCLPIIGWHFRFQRPQQLLTRFAALGYRVLYLDPCQDGVPYRTAGSFLDRWTVAHTDNVLGVKLPTPCRTNIYSSPMDEDEARDMAAAFVDLAVALGVGEARLFVELPYWEPLARRLRQDLGCGLIYDCLDDLSGFANTTAPMLAREHTLMREADLVVSSSRLLHERATAEARRAVLVPNGCDCDHFAAAPPHPDLDGLPRPIVGYFGAIAEWFDAELVAAVARARPDWSFVLIGHASDANLAALGDIANVRMLGEKDYAILPQYLAAFDVGLIPFRDMPLTRATNPVKLFEYFSAGKPVVSSPLPEVMPYAGLAEIAASPEEFVRGIESAVASGSEASRARREVARESSWLRRAEAIEDAWRDTEPLTSVVVVTWNNWDYTRACLDGLFRFTPAGRFEVIVVDNASTDATRLGLYGYQCQHPEMRVIFNDFNRGFSAANNQGLRIARGDRLVLLNNDAIPTPGWLRGMGRWLEDPAIGLVGPVTNMIANEACLRANYRDLAGMLRFAAGVRRKNAGQSFDIPMLAMYCVMMRRDVFEQVGELDERYGVGMFEDNDYSVRVRLAGLRVVCAEDVFVHHFGRSSFSKLDPEEYRRVFEANRLLYEAKWQRTWRPQKMRAA